MKQDIQDFAYVSKDGKLYLLLSDTLYQFQMEDKSYKALQEGMKKEYF